VPAKPYLEADDSFPFECHQRIHHSSCDSDAIQKITAKPYK